VIINSALAKNISIIREIADTFGSQSIVVSLDVKKTIFRGLHPCFRSGRDSIKQDVIKLALCIEKAGAGELIVHHTDRDGTFSGLDHELTKAVSSAVGIPVIACGGASTIEDMNKAIVHSGASAAAAGSIFIYKDRNPQSILISYPTPEDLL
jgi:cyclase